MVRSRLDDLASALKEHAGTALEGLLVYGSAVRGGFIPGKSDVDVMIVLSDDRRPLLEAIGTALQLARASARIECMVLRADEIQDAADVFPLLYDDVRGCHALLHGRDPFADLKISDVHRRLRIEQELREARIRLRRVLSDDAGMPTSLAGPIGHKLKQLRSPLHALLILRGETTHDDDVEAVLRAACAAYQLDPTPLINATSAPSVAADALTRLLDAAIHDAELQDPAKRAVA